MFCLPSIRAGGGTGLNLISQRKSGIPPKPPFRFSFAQTERERKQAGKNSFPPTPFLFARLLLSGGMAEGGFGGNSAMPERIQKEAAPAARSVRSGSKSKSFLFLFEEKNRRAQIKKCEENFLAGWRASASGGGAASLVGVLLKESSNINQKRPPAIQTIRRIVSVLLSRKAKDSKGAAATGGEPGSRNLPAGKYS